MYVFEIIGMNAESLFESLTNSGELKQILQLFSLKSGDN